MHLLNEQERGEIRQNVQRINQQNHQPKYTSHPRIMSTYSLPRTLNFILCHPGIESSIFYNKRGAETAGKRFGGGKKVHLQFSLSMCSILHIRF